MTPEKIIEIACKEYLEISGYFYFKISQPSRHARNKPGIPDLVALKDGRVYFIEVKAVKGKQSPFQITFQNNIENNKGNYLLVHSVEELAHKLMAY